jgi:hypothetical protein
MIRDFIDLIDNRDENWQDRALCPQVDWGIFFPEKGVNATEAIAVCGRCEVRDQCLQFALENHIKDGVYGGHTARERRTMRPGEPRRGPQPVRLARDAQIIALDTPDASANWIAEQVGVSPRTVVRARRRTQLDQAA